jgi:hypothetical protein
VTFEDCNEVYALKYEASAPFFSLAMERQTFHVTEYKLDVKIKQ